MPISQKQLDDNHFVHTHDIVIQGPGPTFQEIRGAVTPEGGCIYLWASPNPVQAGSLDVLYIGKTAAMAARVSQHRASFYGNGTGRKNRDLIESWLADGRRLHVYARRSGAQTIFEKETSLYSAEEAAACAAFQPRWNRARFADVQVPRLIVQGTNQQVDAAIMGNAVAAAVEHVPQGEAFTAFFETLDQPKQQQLLELMALLEQRHPDAGDKVVYGGYSGQPTGYNAKAMFVLGNLPGAGGKARDWFARVPLVDSPQSPLTVIFPIERLAPGVQAELVAHGTASRNVWRPRDLGAFLADPDAYLQG